MLANFLQQWGGQDDLWIFAYASLIWRPDFEFSEQRPAKLHGWHRALKMWSRINRGTPAVPGLVFALLSGGSCQGVAYRVPRQEVASVVSKLWLREMMTGVYDPRTLRCQTDQGPVQALAFTLSRHSPNYTGVLSQAHYQQIFAEAIGRYGSTRDYALQTLESLQRIGITDAALAKLLKSI
ncbi:MAG: gamma-glutamylcyclotransferase [Polaromonas sp.]|nr:gamma-glutamylcyclotransferase [Polaromonas sp.]